MNEVLSKLYETLSKETNIENPFTSTEIIREIERFLRTHFNTEEEMDKAHHHLSDLQETIQQKAFEAGFYTAVRLLMG